MAFTIPDFKFKGIKRIEIPKVDDDFVGGDYGREIIEKYLPQILATHSENAKKIKYLYEYSLGQQDILTKGRLYKKDKKNNHKIVENHAYRQITFKRGFLTGDHREYTHKSDTDSDDLIYLDRYFTDCKFFSKDKDLKDWVYATGIGVTHTAPRIDIIVDDGIDELTKTNKVRYARKEEGFDIEYNAPFTFSTIDPSENFVVYSSRFDKHPLFCVSIASVDVGNGKTIEIKNEIHIETRYASFIVNSNQKYSAFEELQFEGAKTLKYLPLIEYSINRSRIGLVELNKDIFNLVNTINSSIVDMTVDKSNVILVFKNTDIDAQTVEEMNEAGAIIISDSEQARQGSSADLDTITIEIPFDGLNKFTETQLTASYDIAGVPLASAQITSGGDTGQARLLGGGWNNAYIVINDDINSLLGSDYDELALILMLCRQVPNCPLNELQASQIDIKYRINQNDNFVNKTQGIMNLYSVNMPKDEIVKASGLFGDVTTVTKKWEQADKDAKTLLQQNLNENVANKNLEEETSTRVDNRVVSANGDNNSQE